MVPQIKVTSKKCQFVPSPVRRRPWVEFYACVCTISKTKIVHARRKGTNDNGWLPMLTVSLLTLKTVAEASEGNQSLPGILLACTPVYLKNDCKKESSKQSLRSSPGTAKKLGSLLSNYELIFLTPVMGELLPNSLKTVFLLRRS